MPRHQSEKPAEPLSISAVFHAARERRFLHTRSKMGEITIDLVSHAGVDSVSEDELAAVLESLAARGVQLEVIGGGYQCFLIRLRLKNIRTQAEAEAEFEFTPPSSSASLEHLKMLVDAIRDPKTIEQLRMLTMTDAQIEQQGKESVVYSEHIDLRAYTAKNKARTLPEAGTCSLLLTATANPELAAVKQLLAASGITPRRKHVGNTLCHRFTLPGFEEPIAVYAASCHHQGNDSAASTVAALLGELHPRLVILAGIAASLNPKDVQIGDVVIAEQVFRYDSRRKVRDDGVILAPYGLQVDQRMLSHAADLASNDSFLNAVSVRATSVLKTPVVTKVVVGDIASGDAVVDSAEMRQQLLVHSNRKIVALEMESAGVLRACATASAMPRAMVVRGISDYAANKAETDASPAQNQHAAACVASAFALEFLSDYLEVANSIILPA